MSVLLASFAARLAMGALHRSLGHATYSPYRLGMTAPKPRRRKPRKNRAQRRARRITRLHRK